MNASNAQPTTRWWWIRHAPVPQLADRIYGNMDPDADVSDTQRFTSLAECLPTEATWIVSSLQRTHQTARAIEAAGYRLSDLTVEPAFSEQNFGELHGVRHDDHEANRDDSFRYIWPTPPDLTPSGGESFIAVMDRVATAIERHSKALRGHDVVCVAHGGTIRAAIAHALQLSPASAVCVSIESLSLTRLHCLGNPTTDGPSWQILGINERLTST